MSQDSGGVKDVDLHLEVGELIGGERREARVMRGRLERDADDFLGEGGAGGPMVPMQPRRSSLRCSDTNTPARR